MKSCYESTLQLALKHNIRTIAFPCIATGVYMFPKEQACEIAVTSVLHRLATTAIPETVVFCCYEDEDFELYSSRLDATSNAR